MKPNRTPRIAAAAAMVVCMLVAVAALGGVGHAQNVITAAQAAYGKKVTICHKGKNTISISKSAWPAHQRHGDTLGTCAAAKAKKAKAAKAAKAAKIKAAKAKAKAEKAKAEKAKAEQAKAEEAKAEQAKADKGKSEEKKNDHADKPGKGGGKGKGGKG